MGYIIAIDGGGSKSETLIIDTLGNVKLHSLTCSSNPNDIGFNKAFNNIYEHIVRIMKRSKINISELELIVLTIAGIEFGDYKEKLKNMLVSKLNFTNIVVEGDLLACKELAFKDKDEGIVIISGTGFNMSVKRNNTFFNVGGWGYLVDDYLSGFDLGKDALIYASKDINKVGENTLITSLLEKELKGDLWYSMEEIYNLGISRVASFSKIVINAYLNDDSVAKKIINTRINKLSKLIKEVSNKEKMEVMIMGGLFKNNECLLTLLKSKLKGYKINVCNDKPIFGSVLVAKKYLNLDDVFYNDFVKGFKGVF